jgi:hypothetical protein
MPPTGIYPNPWTNETYGPDIARKRHDDGGRPARDPEKFGQSEERWLGKTEHPG